jgi:hypothetical protein
MTWLVQAIQGWPSAYRKISEHKWLSTLERDRAGWATVNRYEHWAEAQEALEELRKATPLISGKRQLNSRRRYCTALTARANNRKCRRRAIAEV